MLGREAPWVKGEEGRAGARHGRRLGRVVATGVNCQQLVHAPANPCIRPLTSACSSGAKEALREAAGGTVSQSSSSKCRLRSRVCVRGHRNKGVARAELIHTAVGSHGHDLR